MKGVLRVFYYRFFLKVKVWQPSYDVINKIYKVKLDGIELYFYQPPFFDIEFAVLDYLKAQPLKNGKVIVDAGSFIGTFAIYAAKLYPKSLIVALEPDPTNYQALLENVKLNKLTNVFTLNQGLWKESRELNFNTGEGERSSFIFSESQAGKIIPIATITLDNLYEQLRSKIDYIKMDIEGAEIEALMGADRCLKECKPKLVIASYHLRRDVPTRSTIEELLKKYYSHVVSIKNRQLLTVAHV